MFGIKVNVKNVLIAIFGIAIVFLLIRGCAAERRADRLQGQLAVEKLENQKLDSIKNKLDQTVYTQEVVIAENNRAITELAKEKFALQKKYEKKIKETVVYYEAKLRAKVDTVEIPFTDTLLVPDFASLEACQKFARDSMVTVPRDVFLDSVGLSFSGTVHKAGFRINSITILDTQYIRFNKVKRNLWQSITFKPRKYEVQVLHTSPFIQVTGQSSLIYIEKKKTKWLVEAAVAGGLIILGSKL